MISDGQHAEGLLRSCLENWSSKSPLINEQSLKEWFKVTSNDFSSHPRLYNDHGLFEISQASKICYIRPSKSVARDISGLPEVHVISSHITWANEIAAIGNETWKRTGSLIEKWMDVCKAADATNKKIHAGQQPTGSSQASHSSMRPCDHSHPCGRCGRSTHCSSLQAGFQGLLVCGKCLNISRKLTGPSIGVYFLLNAMKQRAKQELNFKGLQTSGPTLDNIVIRIQTWLQLKSQGQDQPGISSFDMYSDQKSTVVPQSHNPIFPSLDAMFPFGLTVSGTACRENRIALGDRTQTVSSLSKGGLHHSTRHSSGVLPRRHCSADEAAIAPFFRGQWYPRHEEKVQQLCPVPCVWVTVVLCSSVRSPAHPHTIPRRSPHVSRTILRTV